jgi:tRNA uridine 5-carboxymethylaminomethyl modification enzyme
MVDDLITKGADEPYRMFTSRAEFRLHLRIDNADERLTPVAEEIGLACAERRELFARKRGQVRRLLKELEGSPKAALLRRPEVKIGSLLQWIEGVLGEAPERGVLMTAETEVKYEGYIVQQRRQMERMLGSDDRVIPSSLEFCRIPGISHEVGERLERVRPATLGQAGRIPGVTAAAVAILDVYLTLNGSRLPPGVSRETSGAPVNADVSRETVCGVID